MYRVIALFALLALSLQGLAQTQGASQLPVFSFKQVDTGTLITQKSLKPGLHTIVIFFDPGCDHCQLQAEWIASAINRFPNTQFLWVSTSSPKDIIAFRDKIFKGTTTPMFWVQDSEYKIDDYFGYTTVPSIYVYNTQGSLRVTYRNEVAVEMITPYLK